MLFILYAIICICLYTHVYPAPRTHDIPAYPTTEKRNLPKKTLPILTTVLPVTKNTETIKIARTIRAVQQPINTPQINTHKKTKSAPHNTITRAYMHKHYETLDTAQKISVLGFTAALGIPLTLIAWGLLKQALKDKMIFS